MENMKVGAVLVICSLALMPVMMKTMEWWDEARLEHEFECNPMRNIVIDWEHCGELEEESERRMTIFGITVLAFMLTGVIGLVNLLPEGESDFRVPPPDRI